MSRTTFRFDDLLSTLEELPAEKTPAGGAGANGNGSNGSATATGGTDGAPPPKPTERDIQRGALRDLVALAAECARTESAVEREYRTAQEGSKKTVGDRAFQLDQQHAKAKETADAELKAKLTDVARRYKAQRQQIAADDAAVKAKADAEKAGVDERAKKKYNNAVWEADSVLEVANGQANQNYAAKAGAINGALEELGGYDVAAAKLVQRYGVPIPTDAVQVEPDPAVAADADAAYAARRAAVDSGLARLRRVPLANLFVGGRPILVGFVLVLGAAAFVQFRGPDPMVPQWQPLAYWAGGTLGGLIVIGIVLRVIATKQVRAIHGPLRLEIAHARQAAERQAENAAEARKAELAAAAEARTKEVQNAKDGVAPAMAKAAQARQAAHAASATDGTKRVAALDQTRDKALAAAHEAARKAAGELDAKKAADVVANDSANAVRVGQIEAKYQQEKGELSRRWSDGLARIQAPIDADGQSNAAVLDWTDPHWDTWKPTKKFSTRVRFGEMHVDLEKIAEQVPKRLTLPATFSLPALMAFPAQGSLLIHTDHAGRLDAIRALQGVMTRLLTTLPPGRVRFTIIDPVSLGQNFAGFMHLTDYDDQLVGGRIWTSQDQIEEKLKNLAEHMETVIQKYLRNEFATIDDYNAQAGELAEPYRYLVIADLPVNFTADAFRRLNSIAASGARCGVYTLVARDVKAPLPAGATLDQLKAHSVNLVREEDRFVWDDEVFRQLPLSLDLPPAEEKLTEILHKVGAGAREAKRVEVPFETIAPKNGQMWSGSTTKEVDVMVGRTGATRFQSLKLGKGTSQHVLIAGKTGSGKSTLMHAMITNAALWYSPDEIELYLVDFKKGVEFKTYATHLLPHARAIAIESDREFGLSLLNRLDVELTRRGELFRKAGGVQNLEQYRATAGAVVVPRTLLIIDEYQEFFTEDDRLAQEATLLIERLVRQGRAFGMHVLLGSQTAGGLPRGVMEQFAVRIALATTEAGSQIILGDNNSAARLLTRPGEAIYNDGGGLVEANSPFQVAFLSDSKRDMYLADLASKAEPYFKRFGYPIVFEGSAAAETTRNAKLNAALELKAYPKTPSSGAMAWLGEPVAIKDPTAVQFRRNAGANVLTVGQADEQTMAMFNMMIVSLAAQQGPSQGTFYVFDGTPADSEIAGTFEKTRAALPEGQMKLVDFKATADAIDEIAQEVNRRRESDETGAAIYVFVYGLQRYRSLRKTEDDFSSGASSFSFDSPGEDAPKPRPKPDKQLAEILREGPPVGVHVVCWCDTLVSVDRTFDRGVMREFDLRILFQMSAADSSNLVDNPAANKLGAHRALIYSEEQGTMERFRPYAVPETAFLAGVKTQLSAREPAAVGV